MPLGNGGRQLYNWNMNSIQSHAFTPVASAHPRREAHQSVASEAVLDTVTLSSQALHQGTESLVEADHHGLHKQLALMATRSGVKPGMGAAGAAKVSPSAGQNTALGKGLGKVAGPLTAGLGFWEAGKVAQEMQHAHGHEKTRLGAELASHSLHGLAGTCQTAASWSAGAGALAKVGGVAGGAAYVAQGFADRMDQDAYTQNVGRAEALAGGCLVAGTATLNPPLLVTGAVIGVGSQLAKNEAVKGWLEGHH